MSLSSRKKTIKAKLIDLKYGDLFPLDEYLEEHYPDGHINSSGQFVATCPRCAERGLNGKDKFYFNKETRAGLCHRCNVTDEDGAFRTLVGLVAFTEQISRDEAAQKIIRLSHQDGDDDVDMTFRMLQKTRRSIYNIYNNDNEIDLNMNIQLPIPAKYKLDKDTINMFFKSRNPPMNPKVIKLVPVWGSKLYKLRNRVIFEITTNDSYAWLAYAQNKNIMPKTINPPGSVLSRMLGGYNLIKKSTKPLIVVEGIFDMFRVLLRGYNAVCSFGDKVSVYQIALLNMTNASEIVFCYDTDIEGYGWKAMWKIVKKYRKKFDKPLSLMFMDYEYKNGKKIAVDPDSVSKANFVKAFNNRKQITL